jgi:hypothetical protein
LQTLQTRVESGGGKCHSLNGVLVRPDHSVSLCLEDLVTTLVVTNSSEEVTTLVVTNQLANTQGLPKSEALAVVNIGSDGAAPCVTIEPLIHTVHSVLRDRSRDTTWWQLKNNIAIIRRW